MDINVSTILPLTRYKKSYEALPYTAPAPVRIPSKRSSRFSAFPTYLDSNALLCSVTLTFGICAAASFVATTGWPIAGDNEANKPLVAPPRPGRR